MNCVMTCARVTASASQFNTQIISMILGDTMNLKTILHRLLHRLMMQKIVHRIANASAQMPHDAFLSKDDQTPIEPLLVVFSDDTDLWWLKWLKRGFRHCFVVMRLGGQWVAIDPMAHHVQITVPQLPTDFDLKNWFCAQGLRVIEGYPAPALLRCYPPIFLSCVELVKRILGVRHPLIITPSQLYQYLLSHQRTSWDH